MALLEKEWFIQAPWGRICTLAWGDCCDPPVLVCHGTKDSAASFRPLIRLLPKNFYYIGMEIPGGGRSDPMPPGLMPSFSDMSYSVHLVVKHFRWEKFIYMGHSMGASMGFLYNLCYPGKITKIIHLDPQSTGFVVSPNKFTEWYITYLTNYYKKFVKNNYCKEHRQLYTRVEAIEKIKRRGFSEQLAEETLERVAESTREGLVRFTSDNRSDMPDLLLNTLQIPAEYKKELFTSIKSPTLMIIPEDSKPAYVKTLFMFDEKSYPGNNYRVRIVKGNHDVHAVHPERIARFISQFLLYGLEGLDNKAKL